MSVCLRACICAMPGACGGQRRASEPLEVELQMLCTAAWALGTDTGSLASALLLLTTEPSLQPRSPHPTVSAKQPLYDTTPSS